MSILNLIGDLTTGVYGGYQAVLAVHAEGSIEAEKLAMLRAYDPKRAVNWATNLAGLSHEVAGQKVELPQTGSGQLGPDGNPKSGLLAQR